MSYASSSSVSSSRYASPPSSKKRDPYYGYGPISAVANNVLLQLYPPTGEAVDPTPINYPGTPLPRLIEFIAYALYRTRLPDSIVYSALLLLTRLKEMYPTARGTTSSPHRLFLSGLMLASKMSMDDTYSNKSWVIVGQNIFTLAEVNRMERELFGFLNMSCHITKDELLSWCQEWCDDPEAYGELEDYENDEEIEREDEEDNENCVMSNAYEEDENYDEEDEDEEDVNGIREAPSIAVDVGPSSAQSTPPNQFESSSNTPTSSTTTTATTCSPPHTPEILVHPKHQPSSPAYTCNGTAWEAERS
ncbi:hypothetical protein BY996DRAFT_4575282 [Phakopsora pachyrhizi]|uniref:Expressed protein n=1 Tax=Phakopsora pachyrhizi TaxID=170000 RepID=A0AAV0B083_PHAPC|nr:hypothetical protein BY996DRAFT_4575282 [Phakopsora pachyrhizi]CAH7676335.1 expressed protein [Phakopsora pachyrhizi]